jgi:hypothetical protein
MTIVGEPFETVHQALAWAITSRTCDGYGTHHRHYGTVPRPCEPSDVLGILRMLLARKQITREDMEVLEAWIDGRPDARVGSARAVEVERLIAFHLRSKGLLAE